MKTAFTFLLGAIIGVGGLYLYNKFEARDTDAAFVVQIGKGQRVKVNSVEDFEKLLNTIAPSGPKGTFVNLLPVFGQGEVQGPIKNLSTNSYEFQPVPTNAQVGPAIDGCIHNTQQIFMSSKDDFQKVVGSFDFSRTEKAPAATETAPATSTISTPTPIPTASP
ncbi:MAG: hypothetical protein ABI925_10615 [Verrucomicrobiota bacterium]